MIEQRGVEWCLLTKDGSRVLGCHDSKEKAEAQERAIEARAHAEKELFRLQGVEIFRSGTWNGDDYRDEDLDALVAASREVGFTPPVKAGHEDKSGRPALGWVENLRRVGSALLADLVALPKAVYDAIQQRRFDRVSAEIYWNLERNGMTYPRVLKALALLGAEIPAVDLQPLSAFLSMPPMPTLPAWRFAAYAVELKPAAPAATRTPMPDDTTTPEPTAPQLKEGEVIIKLSQLEDLKAAVARGAEAAVEPFKVELQQKEARLAQIEAARQSERIAAKILAIKVPAFRPFAQVFYELAHQTNGLKAYTLGGSKTELSAEDVVDRWVAELNRHAEKLFQVLSVATKPVDADEPDEPRAKVDYRVKKHMQKVPGTDYKAAMKAVLDADPELKLDYARP